MYLNQNNPSNAFRIAVTQSIDENLQCSLTRETVIPIALTFILPKAQLSSATITTWGYHINLYKRIGNATIMTSVLFGLFLENYPSASGYEEGLLIPF